MNREPLIQVGIMHEATIRFEFLHTYQCEGTPAGSMEAAGARELKGEHTVTLTDEGYICWKGVEWKRLRFVPLEEGAQFELKEVTIGINFHWQRRENQRFKGILELKPEDGKLWAVNVLPAEEYLTSVISSEMSAHASMSLLRAHAVISRSWLLANLPPFRKEEMAEPTTCVTPEGHCLKWYERDAHTLFDVCADDHCQRYQGVTRASTPAVAQAVAETRGEVLMDEEGAICDARFSKCCGGAFEEFSYCWADHRYPYLRRGRDLLPPERDACPPLPDLTQEVEAERWIRSVPPAFCQTRDAGILSQVLNNYDQETTDFYRWRVEYTRQELSDLVRRRSGTDYGEIIDLIPRARGTSGRLWQLEVVGTRHRAVIGKELEIRRILSPSHLYSSAFVVDKEEPDAEGRPGRFVLTGAGWGHGVGLCQIGAAVMGARGYDYRTILHHYFPGAQIEKIYGNPL